MSNRRDKADQATGPVEAATAAATDRLIARVVKPGPAPQVHGYSVEDDLAPNYTYVDLALLALTGDLAEEPVRRAFEVAISFWAPATIAEAPSHAAAIARLCGAHPSGLFGVAMVTLAEQVSFLLEQNAALLAWLGDPEGEFPATSRASDEDDRCAVARLRQALGSQLPFPVLDHDPSRNAAVLGVLYGCGLVDPEYLQAALVWGRFPCVVAEGLAGTPVDLCSYPLNIPGFEYTGPRREVSHE